MSGTWIEPTLASTVYGQATVPTNAVPDDSDDTSSLTLDKSLVSLSPSGTTTFTASGGTAPYTWQVSNGAIGRITSISGAGNSTAAYAASGTGDNRVTATDSAGRSASAIVRQTASGGDGGAGAVTLNPTLVTIDADRGTAVFTAAAGQGLFTWRIRDAAIGRITSISGTRNATAIYTATAPGSNTLTVNDETGASASATVMQVVFEGDDPVLPPIP